MAELATWGHRGEPVTATFMAEARNIPEKYLVHILLQLKRAKLLTSMRGAQGGYLLARPPEQITLLDIVHAIDGPILDPLPVDPNGSRDLVRAWRRVAESIEDVLRDVTLIEIVRRGASRDMYYI